MSFQHELLIELLRDVNRGMGRHVKEVLDKQDLPIIMITMAKQIGGEPGITVSEIARRTGIAKSHVSNSIRELEKRGWVEKKTDSNDQRLIRLFLTPLAVGRMQVVRGEIREMLRTLVSGIPEQRTIELIAALEEIKSIVEVESPDNCKTIGTSHFVKTKPDSSIKDDSLQAKGRRGVRA